MSVIDVNAVSAEARELSVEEQEDRAQVCFALEADIKTCIAAGRAAVWSLCERLYEFDQAQGWLALGYKHQTDWLAQPEIGITRTEYFRMIRRHRECVLNRQLSTETLLELEPSKVDIVMPAIEANALPMDEIVDDVQTLGAKDLREKYLGVAPPPPKKKDDAEDEDDAPAELTEEEKAAVALRESLSLSATTVDSWVCVGGDRRKAQRHLKRIVEDHPFFNALRAVEASVEGAEGSLRREELGEAWETIIVGLGLEIEEGV